MNQSNEDVIACWGAEISTHFKKLCRYRSATSNPLMEMTLQLVHHIHLVTQPQVFTAVAIVHIFLDVQVFKQALAKTA